MVSEKKEIIRALYFPCSFVVLLWIIYFISTKISFNLSILGLHPLSWKGLAGIFFAPLIHLDFDHLFNNTTSFIVIGFGLFYLYKRAAISIFFFIYFLSGLWGWFFAREGYHIGASGLIYGMFFFLITSAFLKKERKLIAFSLIIIFLYGAIVWGFFPDFFPGKNISWEIHTTGAVAGAIAAFFFKNEGPKKHDPFADEEDEEEEENEDEDAYWKLPNQNKNFN
ncbi:MAG TPA: rhomboid family intramembrane serine protease [Bacteroidales bacterium]|jgi:membrane associated rhomboid family serine protease|nr:rhomboid family intramembrane serine protease [Bacteroidales bacterium]HOF16674.1 rhomboid family intramembrane serine protease [Bacteroidales bacterium]HON20079.1 rhomboid family intramembrane serine protease [Bacteroidales bacterium]HOR82424.1 rhomboid family intramembrane serine protease [Bacteroidales bacterium]HPJ91656.1 rhomboid family intramembrane serine protease [Bacteroidales bacterium]